MTILCAWLWFAAVQLICFAAAIVGWLLLIPFCFARAWTADATSIKDGRPIDRWTWRPLNLIYGNPEDGVSGQTAFIWVNGSLSFYMRDAWAPWRAYMWSAWRNSADNLKYAFQWIGGPFRRWQGRAFYVQLGWNNNGLPVISAGRL